MGRKAKDLSAHQSKGLGYPRFPRGGVGRAVDIPMRRIPPLNDGQLRKPRSVKKKKKFAEESVIGQFKFIMLEKKRGAFL